MSGNLIGHIVIGVGMLKDIVREEIAPGAYAKAIAEQMAGKIRGLSCVIRASGNNGN